MVSREEILQSEDRPRVSVLMCVRDGLAYLDAAVESILAQSFSSFEFVIVDNASAAPTAERLRRWAEEDARIRLLQLARPGLSRALNFGIAHCRAPLVARMDADDISLPERLAKQVAFMDAHPEIAVVGSWAMRIDRKGRELYLHATPETPGALREALKLGCPLIHPTVMIRADALKAVGGYKEFITHTQDYDLWLRLSERYDLANIQEALLLYRLHGESLSSAGAVRQMIGGAFTMAAARARAAGLPEPRTRYGVSLRRALAILGLSREDFSFATAKHIYYLARSRRSEGDLESAARLRRHARRFVRAIRDPKKRFRLWLHRAKSHRPHRQRRRSSVHQSGAV